MINSCGNWAHLLLFISAGSRMIVEIIKIPPNSFKASS
jgi:hypothetical protein